MRSVCLPLTHSIFLTSPSVSNEITLLPSLQKCRLCLSINPIKTCPSAFLGQFLQYHPWTWSSHSFPSNNNYLASAPLELVIKHRKRNSDFQMSEGISFLFPTSCLLPRLLPSFGSPPHAHLVHLFSRLESWPVLHYHQKLQTQLVINFTCFLTTEVSTFLKNTLKAETMLPSLPD